MKMHFWGCQKVMLRLLPIMEVTLLLSLKKLATVVHLGLSGSECTEISIHLIISVSSDLRPAPLILHRDEPWVCHTRAFFLLSSKIAGVPVITSDFRIKLQLTKNMHLAPAGASPLYGNHFAHLGGLLRPQQLETIYCRLSVPTFTPLFLWGIWIYRRITSHFHGVKISFPTGTSLTNQ